MIFDKEFGRITQRFMRAKPAKTQATYQKIEAPEQLLSNKKRSRRVEIIPRLLTAPAVDYDELYTPAILAFANHVQLLPATEAAYGSQPGGLLNLGLETAVGVMTLLKQYYDDPANQVEHQDLWSYATFSACLLREVGRLYTDLKVECFDHEKKSVAHWNPFSGPLSSIGPLYQVEFTSTDERLRYDVTPLLARQLMPTSGYDWIAKHPAVLRYWLAILTNAIERIGMLQNIIGQGFFRAIVNLIEEELLLKTEQQIEHEKLLELEALNADPEQAGKVFFLWLKTGLLEGILSIDQKDSMIFTDNKGELILTKDLFDKFSKQHPKYPNAEKVLSKFSELGFKAGVNDTKQTTIKTQASSKSEIKTGFEAIKDASGVPREGVTLAHSKAVFDRTLPKRFKVSAGQLQKLGLLKAEHPDASPEQQQQQYEQGRELDQSLNQTATSIKPTIDPSARG